MRGCNKEREGHVIRLCELMKEHGGDFKLPLSSKPKKHLKEDIESNGDHKSQFYVRSKIANLKLQQKKISYAEI